MRKLLFLGGIFFWCNTLCSSAPGQDTNASTLLSEAPTIRGGSYYCGAMVRAVNALRRLGKEQAIEILRTFLKENGPYAAPEQHQKLLLVCRLLFVNPDGWKYPTLGQPEPEIDWKVGEQLPVFPMALSQGVPFLLLRGYSSGGYTSDTVEKCVELCKGFNLISEDLPEQGYEKAARALVTSQTFEQLYVTPEGRKEAEAMVLAQTRPGHTGPRSKGKIEVEFGPSPR